jgi:hypothetical protein
MLDPLPIALPSSLASTIVVPCPADDSHSPALAGSSPDLHERILERITRTLSRGPESNEGRCESRGCPDGQEADFVVSPIEHGDDVIKEPGMLIPIADSEPVSIVKPEPPMAAGQGSGSQARTTPPLGTQWSARSDVGRGMWRGGMSPIDSGARTRPVKGVVVGRATAESPAAGRGAGRDRRTSAPGRSSSVSRGRRRIRARGSDEPVTDDTAA